MIIEHSILTTVDLPDLYDEHLQGESDSDLRVMVEQQWVRQQKQRE